MLPTDRRVPFVVLGVLIAAAQALALDLALAPPADVWAPVPAPPPVHAPPPPLPPEPLDDYVDAVLERNVFDHSAIGVEAERQDAWASRSELPVRLLGTLVAEPARFSSALIVPEDDEAAVATGYGIGDRLLDATVVDIAPRRVTLRRADGEFEYLVADDDPYAAGLDEPVTLVSDDLVLVDRGYLEELLADQASLSRMARVRLYRRNGEVQGYRLFRIRKDSPLYAMGLRNGDTITAVDGAPLTSLSAAMGLLEKARGADEIELDILRRRDTRSLTVRVI